MAFLRKNFSKGVLATSLSLAGATLTVNSGHTLPVEAGTMRLVIWDSATYPDPSDDPSVEIVTGEYSGTGTVYDITRAQEDTSPSAHVTGSAVALNMTAAVSLETRYSDEEVRDVIGAILDDGSLGDISYTYTDNGDATSTIQGDIKVALKAQYDAAYAHVSASGASHSAVVLNTTHRGLTNNPHTVTPTQLSLVIGTNVQAYGAGLNDLSALGAPASDGQFIVATGIGAYQFEATTVARTSLGVGEGDSPKFAGGEYTGTVKGVDPAASTDLATRAYVDKVIAAFRTFYLSDTASGVGSLDYAYDQETGDAVSTEVSGSMGEADDQLIKGWITEAGSPGTLNLLPGTLLFHIHAKKGAANQRTTQLYAVLSTVDADGTSNKATIGTTEVSEVLTENEICYRIRAAIGTATPVADTSRLVLDVYANVGAGAVDSVVTLYLEGLEDSFWSVSVDSGTWQSHSVVLDDIDELGRVVSDGQMIVGVSAGVYAYESGATLRTSLGLGTEDSPQFTGMVLTGDLTFEGSAGFYPRWLVQAEIPESGAGDTQIDVGELVIWEDSDTDEVNMIYNSATSGVGVVSI